MTSSAAWLSWRCGIAPVAAREHLRVARALESLPETTAAFSSGELSFSKVRALTRVATADNESTLVMWARHTTAAQLESIVRAYRGVVASERACAEGKAAEPFLRWLWDDDGSLVVYGRLAPEDAGLFLQALHATSDRLERDAEGSSAEPPRDVSAETGPDASAETPGDTCAKTGPDASSTTRDEGIYTGTTPDASIGPDVSAQTGRDVSSQPSVSAETPVEPLPRPSPAEALVAMAETALATGPKSGGADRYQVVVHVDAEVLEKDSLDGRCHVEDGPALAPEIARRVACDASVVEIIEEDGSALDVGRKRRTIPPALRRALEARDQSCRWPGCGRRRFLECHHVTHWAHGGPTRPDNLALLCRFHHRLVHHGDFTVTIEPDGRVTISRPDNEVIPGAPSPPPAQRDLGDVHRHLGLLIDPSTCVGKWDGYGVDYALCVDVLLGIDRNPWQYVSSDN
jgi:hypothetical protein